jgi:transcriptional regulator with XRE-family HTH domain
MAQTRAALNLRRLRVERGLTQEALAHSTKIARQYMSEIERGKVWIGLRMMAKFAKALQVEPAEFFRRWSLMPFRLRLYWAGVHVPNGTCTQPRTTGCALSSRLRSRAA